MIAKTCFFIACAVFSVQASCLEKIVSSCGPCGNVESAYPSYVDSCGSLPSYPTSYDSLPISSYPAPCGPTPNIVNLQGPPPAVQPRVIDTNCVCTKTIVNNQPIRRLVIVKSIQRYVKKFYKPVVQKVEYTAQPRGDCENAYPSEVVSSSYPQYDAPSCSQSIAGYPSVDVPSCSQSMVGYPSVDVPSCSQPGYPSSYPEYPAAEYSDSCGDLSYSPRVASGCY